LSAVLKVRLCKYDIFAEAGWWSGIAGEIGASDPREKRGKCWEKSKKCGRKKRRGASLRGQGTPALFLHASAVSEQENRKRLK